jgi:hypothetical protein
MLSDPWNLLCRSSARTTAGAAQAPLPIPEQKGFDASKRAGHRFLIRVGVYSKIRSQIAFFCLDLLTRESRCKLKDKASDLLVVT